MTEVAPIITVSVSGEVRANAPVKHGSTINLVLSSDTDITVHNIAFDLAGGARSLLKDKARTVDVKVALVPQDGRPTEELSIKNWDETILAIIPQGVTIGPDNVVSLNLSNIACDRPPQDTPLDLKIGLYHAPIVRPHAAPDAAATALVKCSADSCSFNALEMKSQVVLEGQLKNAALCWDIEAPIGTSAYVTLQPEDQANGVRSQLLLLQEDGAQKDKTVLPLEAGEASFADLFGQESKVLNLSEGPVRISMTMTWTESGSDKVHSISRECGFFYLTTGHWRRLPLEFMNHPAAIHSAGDTRVSDGTAAGQRRDQSLIWGIFPPTETDSPAPTAGLYFSESAGHEWTRTAARIFPARAAQMPSCLLQHRAGGAAGEGQADALWFIGGNQISRYLDTDSTPETTEAFMLSLDHQGTVPTAGFAPEMQPAQWIGQPPPYRSGHTLHPVDDNRFLLMGGKTNGTLMPPLLITTDRTQCTVKAQELTQTMSERLDSGTVSGVAFQAVGAGQPGEAHMSRPVNGTARFWPFKPGIFAGCTVLRPTKTRAETLVFTAPGVVDEMGDGLCPPVVWRGRLDGVGTDAPGIHWDPEPYFVPTPTDTKVIAANLSVFDNDSGHLCYLVTDMQSETGETHNHRFILDGCIATSDYKRKINCTDQLFQEGVGWQAPLSAHLLKSTVAQTGTNNQPAVLCWVLPFDTSPPEGDNSPELNCYV